MQRHWRDVDRKVPAATAGAALGAIVEAAMVGGLGFEWWPPVATPTVFAFIAGYLVPDRTPPAEEG